MKLRTHKLALACALMVSLAASAANALVTFSDVQITGTLSTGATFNTGLTDIDFTFPDAAVGDPFHPRRQGNVVITFEATATDMMVADQINITALGAIAGSGTIVFNEVIEDQDILGTIATDNAVFDVNNPLPYSKLLVFDRPTRRIKVKKTFTFLALDSVDPQVFDLAVLTFVEQNIHIVPELGTIAAVSAGLLGLAGLRRRK